MGPFGSGGVETGSSRRSSLKGRERVIVSQTNIGVISKAAFGETSERRDGAHMDIFERIDTILNWNELIGEKTSKGAVPPWENF